MDIIHFPLKVLNKIYGRIFNIKEDSFIPSDIPASEEQASRWIYELLTSDAPCMIGRFGSTELNTTLNAQSHIKKKHSIIDYIRHKEYGWWWNPDLLYAIQNNAGFFPVNEDMLIKYSERMLEDMKELDLLGDFTRSVRYVEPILEGVRRVHIKDLEPIYGSSPWTRALKGKKVLVVHPLADLIRYQYEVNREKLFANPDMLPEFELVVVPAVQSLGGDNSQFANWFEALDWMENEIDKKDYDICLIGCGAYGFCLAAHCKRMGKIGFHIGGYLQYMFGIIGSRWNDPNYGVERWGIPKGKYSNNINQFWVRPDKKYIPLNASKVENGCYW